MSSNPGFINWMSSSETETKELYFSVSEDGPWQHYSQLKPQIPDYTIPNGSKGYRAMQTLLKRGYKFPTNN
jgi:hypothetical protein